MSGDLTPYLPALATALGIQLMGILSPGPAILMVIGHGLSRGRRAVTVSTLGIATGSGLLACATVAGVSAVVAELSWAMQALRVVGALYLGWLAWKALQRSRALTPLRPMKTLQRSEQLFLQGALMQVSNPKAILFWLAIAAVGGLATAPWEVKALFVGAAMVQSFLGHAAYGWLLGGAALRARYEAARRWIERGLAGLFGLAALSLAFGRS